MHRNWAAVLDPASQALDSASQALHSAPPPSVGRGASGREGALPPGQKKVSSVSTAAGHASDCVQRFCATEPRPLLAHMLARASGGTERQGQAATASGHGESAHSAAAPLKLVPTLMLAPIADEPSDSSSSTVSHASSVTLAAAASPFPNGHHGPVHQAGRSAEHSILSTRVLTDKHAVDLGCASSLLAATQHRPGDACTELSETWCTHLRRIPALAEAPAALLSAILSRVEYCLVPHGAPLPVAEGAENALAIVLAGTLLRNASSSTVGPGWAIMGDALAGSKRRPGSGLPYDLHADAGGPPVSVLRLLECDFLHALREVALDDLMRSSAATQLCTVPASARHLFAAHMGLLRTSPGQLLCREGAKASSCAVVVLGSAITFTHSAADEPAAAGRPAAVAVASGVVAGTDDKSGKRKQRAGSVAFSSTVTAAHGPAACDDADSSTDGSCREEAGSSSSCGAPNLLRTVMHEHSAALGCVLVCGGIVGSSALTSESVHSESAVMATPGWVLVVDIVALEKDLIKQGALEFARHVVSRNSERFHGGPQFTSSAALNTVGNATSAVGMISRNWRFRCLSFCHV